MNKPYWLFLLESYLQNLNRSGLTIPFIIGAKPYFEINNNNLNNVRELLLEMQNIETSKTFTIKKCQAINEYVIGIDNDAHFLNGYVPRFGNITLNDGAFKDERSFESIIVTLEKKYNECIENSVFSKNNGKWINYSEDDLETINSAKSNYDKYKINPLVQNVGS
jgi:hypothetical protein